MFKRPKHVFTCPDVIYLVEKNRRHNRNTLIAIAATYGVLFLGGWIATKVVETREATEPLLDDIQSVDLP